MDYNALRERAKAVQSIHVDDRKFIAAILYHDVKPEDICGDFNLLWIKAHKKIKASQIKASYLGRDIVDPDSTPPSDVHIVFDNVIAAPTTTLADLNCYGDRLIVFRAVDVDSPEGIILSRADAANTIANREPLQAVNRQLSASSVHPSHSSPVPALKTEGPENENSLPSTQSSTIPPAKADPYLESPKPVTSDQNSASFPTPPHHLHYSPTPRRGVGHQLTQRIGLDKADYLTPRQILDHHVSYNNSRLGPVAVPPHLPGTTPGWVHDPSVFSHRPLESPGEMKRPTFPLPQSLPSKVGTERSPSPDLPAQDFLATSDSKADDHEEINMEFMQGLINETDAEVLEQAVKKGMRVLKNVRTPIAAHPDSNVEATQWLQQIDNIQTQAKRIRTIVGVVGNTGAGKSSVINALLDEERLVPTNCMRACTAVVTEISWNEDTDPSHKYRAAIEFISQADWKKELDVLFKDLLDESGHISRECTNPDTEAGVAYAKIRAVYPQRTRDEITTSSVQGLIEVWGVKNVLGTTKQLRSGCPDKFYRSLQKYVDSTEKEDEKEKKKPKRMEYWPLIKCVKIYARSDALSTGAVIVDLPGVQDSNAARAAVAEGYMKQCSGLWIVAPINRAVNDKAAKKLLGDQFKRQMKYDGMFSNVTFICSKTDDISITEAAPSLGIEDKVQGSWDEIKSLEKERQALKDKVDELKEQQECYSQVFADQDALVDVWERLETELEEGKVVYAPVEKSKKRKRKTGNGKSSKRINWDSDIEEISQGEDESGSDSDSDQTSDVEVSERSGNPLTAEQIKDKLEQLKTTKKDARKEKGRLGDLIKTSNKEKAEINRKIKELNAQIASVCIAGRNDWSRTRIQEDYALGIKELDQENAMEKDEENFNPDDDIRDYDKIAQSLPVFCVSSRAYQKLSGRLEKDGKVAGFMSEEETEMPQLKDHCKRLTEAGRAGTCRVFLNALSQLLLSLSLWAGNDGSGIKLTDEQNRIECNILQKRLQELEDTIDKAVESSANAIKTTLAEYIFDNYDEARKTAEKMALPTAKKWSGPRDSGGLYYMTYKATCRRDGVFRDLNFNKQLADPLEKYLVNGWDKCFSKGMPQVLEQFKTDMTHRLKEFHNDIEDRARGRGVGIVGLRILSQKLETQEAYFGTLTDQLGATISDKQREANRELTPVIAAAMKEGYVLCVDERGKGAYARMRDHMAGHVHDILDTVFKDATDTVRGHLKAMAREVEIEMADRTEEVFQEVQKDYMTVIAGVKLPEGYVMPKAERQMRELVAEAVKGAEKLFLKPDVPDLDDDELKDEFDADINATNAESDDDLDTHASDRKLEGDAEEATEDLEGDVCMPDGQVNDDCESSGHVRGDFAGTSDTEAIGTD